MMNIALSPAEITYKKRKRHTVSVFTYFFGRTTTTTRNNIEKYSSVLCQGLYIIEEVHNIKDHMHQINKEMILLRLLERKVFMNEEQLKEKEGGLGFYRGQ